MRNWTCQGLTWDLPLIDEYGGFSWTLYSIRFHIKYYEHRGRESDWCSVIAIPCDQFSQVAGVIGLFRFGPTARQGCSSSGCLSKSIGGPLLSFPHFSLASLILKLSWGSSTSTMDAVAGKQESSIDGRRETTKRSREQRGPWKNRRR